MIGHDVLAGEIRKWIILRIQFSTFSPQHPFLQLIILTNNLTLCIRNLISNIGSNILANSMRLKIHNPHRWIILINGSKIIDTDITRLNIRWQLIIRCYFNGLVFISVQTSQLISQYFPTNSLECSLLVLEMNSLYKYYKLGD